MLNGQSFRAERLGPLIEFGNLATVEGLPTIEGSDWLDANPLRAFVEARSITDTNWLQSDGRIGFISGRGLSCDQALTSFKIDAHKAALAANFGKSAALLVAALGELIGNVVDHSEATHTGIATFGARDSSFEFVVADRGIGALKSLHKCVEHAEISDEGAALCAMIEQGVSRYGSETMHGNGFQPIFEKLADMQGMLRFRSGDFGLSLDGRFGNKISLQLSQKPRLSGVFIAVVCNL